MTARYIPSALLALALLAGPAPARASEPDASPIAPGVADQSSDFEIRSERVLRPKPIKRKAPPRPIKRKVRPRPPIKRKPPPPPPPIRPRPRPRPRPPIRPRPPVRPPPNIQPPPPPRPRPPRGTAQAIALVERARLDSEGMSHVSAVQLLREAFRDARRVPGVPPGIEVCLAVAQEIGLTLSFSAESAEILRAAAWQITAQAAMLSGGPTQARRGIVLVALGSIKGQRAFPAATTLGAFVDAVRDHRDLSPYGSLAAATFQAIAKAFRGGYGFETRWDITQRALQGILREKGGDPLQELANAALSATAACQDIQATEVFRAFFSAALSSHELPTQAQALLRSSERKMSSSFSFAERRRIGSSAFLALLKGPRKNTL